MNNENLKKILWASLEDYVGLWELVWEIQPLQKDKDFIHLKETIHNTLKILLDKKMINLFLCKEPYGEINLVEENFEDLLANDNFWQEPSKDSLSLRISATKDGEKYYKKLNQQLEEGLIS